jgi:capsular exopolysaccharide synthesis family protein
MPSVAAPLTCPDDRPARTLVPKLLGDEVGQACQALWRRLFCRATDSPPAPRTLGLTSCASGEGVSTVAAQLAITAASAGQRVLLLDANLERPSLHRLFALKRGPGFAHALGEDSRLEDVIQSSALPNLSVLTAGQVDTDMAPCQDTAALAAFVGAAKRAFPLVVFDLPALARTNFTARLAGLLDGVVLVVEAERVRRALVRHEKEMLEQAGTVLLGAVLNKRRQYVPTWLSRFL